METNQTKPTHCPYCTDARKVVGDLLALLDKELVRDISRDGEADYFKRMVHMGMVLKAAYDLANNEVQS